MAENKNKRLEVIDLGKIIKDAWNRKWFIFKALCVAFVLSSIYILPVPRTYTTEVKVAPETENSLSGGALSNIMSTMGLDFDQMQTNDAISPILYPDLLDDNGFASKLFNIHVESADGEIKTTYYDYLAKYQKQSPWSAPIRWMRKLFKSKKSSTDVHEFDPYWMTKIEDTVTKKLRKNIHISIDKKTAVITINVTDQDKLICRSMADSTRLVLMNFITDYRTTKARFDMDYYTELVDEARMEYEQARQRYAAYGDSHTDASLPSVRSRLDDLENDMQLKYNTYSTLSAQQQASKAKVQERTPAFTLVKGAAVPIRPTGPKRVYFVFGMLMLTFFGCFVYIEKEEIRKFFKPAEES